MLDEFFSHGDGLDVCLLVPIPTESRRLTK